MMIKVCFRIGRRWHSRIRGISANLIVIDEIVVRDALDEFIYQRTWPAAVVWPSIPPPPRVLRNDAADAAALAAFTAPNLGEPHEPIR